MKVRNALLLALGAIGVVLVIMAVRAGAETGKDSLLLNLGTEVLGIAATVGIIERVIERNRATQEAARIAWAALDEIDSLVWIWQGGSRAFNLEELRALLTLAQADDPLPMFTENLFMQLGGRSQYTLHDSADAVRANRHLHGALETLANLGQVRDRHIRASGAPLDGV